MVSNNTYVAKCLNDQWWVAPTCRHDPEECIPVITAGSGWMVQAMMHWSTVYGLPTAIGVAKTQFDYVHMVTHHDILFYWWVPDDTFVLQRPHSINFPPHVAGEWAEGENEDGGRSPRHCQSSSNFANKAPKVNSFISNFYFELAEVQELLLEVSGSTSSAVACRWIQDNRVRWEDWLPLETSAASAQSSLWWQPIVGFVPWLWDTCLGARPTDMSFNISVSRAIFRMYIHGILYRDCIKGPARAPVPCCKHGYRIIYLKHTLN